MIEKMERITYTKQIESRRHLDVYDLRVSENNLHDKYNDDMMSRNISRSTL